MSEIVILFDEYGVPTFKSNRPSDWFLGVSVLYRLKDENSIMTACDQSFGLSNTKVRKNDRIGRETARNMAESLQTTPIQICIININLNNKQFIDTTNLYNEIGNKYRIRIRRVRSRSISQVIHDEVMDDCILESIRIHNENKGIDNYIYLPHIDNWSFPNADVEISLSTRSFSMADKINSIFTHFGFDNKITIKPINLLDVDSKRKRFIDGVTCIISRAYFDNSHIRYTKEPLDCLVANLENNIQILDTTDRLIEFFQKFINRYGV